MFTCDTPHWAPSSPCVSAHPYYIDSSPTQPLALCYSTNLASTQVSACSCQFKGPNRDADSLTSRSHISPSAQQPLQLQQIGLLAHATITNRISPCRIRSDAPSVHALQGAVHWFPHLRQLGVVNVSSTVHALRIELGKTAASQGVPQQNRKMQW